jgi:antitoxin (DNA-binding transcriptional repressor) of toxin-antitoxin stability system
VTDLVADPFDTAGVRGRVLDAWAASPSRFREDANAEDDYALGGYRDRVVVELAQNAADAAVRAGVPGRLRLTLRDRVLVALNTGVPLDAAGVEALSTLRASSKRGDAAGGGTVGRFGVGFAAVVAVSDSPRIRSATGAVGWSRTRTAELAGAIPALAGEIEARSGHVPVLRLPFPDMAPSGVADALPDGFATAVELPLRDDAAVRLVTRLLAETGPALLLALPALTHVEITAGGVTRLLTAVHDGEQSTVTVNGVPSAWRVAGAGGELDQSLLADRPAEERLRTSWSVRWAVPVSDSGPAGRLPVGVAAVAHAPTPTDEPLSLPALLLASFPLSPDRRHVAPGPLTDFLIERAADEYAGLLPDLSPGTGLLDLVPGPVGQGELDARLARAIVSRLPWIPFLPAVGGDPEADVSGTLVTGRVRPRDALLLATSAAGLSEWLAPVLPNLVAGPLRHPAWAVLGVRRMPLAELADLLAALDREPAWWHRLYAALAGVPAEERAELGALPVPLADGRLVRGPRGLLLPGQGLEHADRLAVLGLRVVAPEAAHPLLTRLGAVEATPRSVLEDPSTRAAVRNSYESAVEAAYDDDSPQRLADAVLGLLAALDIGPGEYPWLAELALPGDDGDWYPAGELLLPGAPLAEVIADDAPFGTIGSDLVERHGPEALQAAGALWSFGLLRAEDVELDESQIDLDLDGADDWAAATSDRLRPAEDGLPPLPPVAVEFTAVRDLDLVDKDRWPQALDLLTRPPLRAAFIEPTRVLLPDGGHADVPSYTAWWLRRNVTLGGRRPSDLRVADADQLLAGLYDPVGVPGAAGAEPALTRVLADPAIARALGVRSTLAALLAEPGGADELLARLADPARPVTRPQLRALWSALATASAMTPEGITPPDRVRAVHGDKITVADANDVLILDAPDLWPLVAEQPLIVVPAPHAARLGELLDLPLVSEEVQGGIESAGEARPVPDIVPDVLPGAPATYQEHDRLTVDGADVPWRYTGGELHAATVEGLAHGLAWAAGRWQDRHLLAALLMSPEETARLLAESDLDT